MDPPPCPCSSPKPASRKASRGARQRGNVLIDISQTRDEPAVQLAPGVLEGKFRLSPEEVQGLRQEYGLSEDELLNLLITPASRLARPPISSFRVG
jgi:hypothetical protein